MTPAWWVSWPSLRNLTLEIIPAGITCFDQGNLLGSCLALERLLSLPGLFNGGVLLEIDQAMNVVFLAEAWNQALLVEMDSLRQIACTANIQYGLTIVGQDVSEAGGSALNRGIHCSRK